MLQQCFHFMHYLSTIILSETLRFLIMREEGPPSSSLRLQKYIADKGIASRREAERLISEGAVTVNGEVIREMGVKIDPVKDLVEVSGKHLKKRSERLIYIALNKPAGYVTTSRKTEREDKIVLDLLRNIPERVFPVGRLDKESTGLLLLTNDGTLTYELTHPSFEHEKEYLVEAFNDITPGMLQKLRSGLSLFGGKTLPPEIELIEKRKMLITLKEGKNRQIRRILRKIGTGVKSLKRVRIGGLSLEPNWRPGEYQFLTKSDVLRYFGPFKKRKSSGS